MRQILSRQTLCLQMRELCCCALFRSLRQGEPRLPEEARPSTLVEFYNDQVTCASALEQSIEQISRDRVGVVEHVHTTQQVE